MSDIAAIVEQYRAATELFAEEALRPYLNSLAKRTEDFTQDKEFNDPIWGTLVLRGHEVLILDSPLLQRLRRIRQLGVAHLVYPAAVHTRLEHSLGTCHQVHRLVQSINDHAKDVGHPLIGDDLHSLLRVAALCHDVGHGLMSHVVENALRNDRRCEKLLLSFRQHVQKDSKSQLSEMAAYFIILSPAFRELLEHAYRLSGQLANSSLANKIAKLIIGKNVDDAFPLLHELITGPFDADKLDYMPRDATMCGVPVVTDVTRLIQKVRAVQVTQENLPDELAMTVEEGPTTFTVVGIARSGASTLDELALSRSLMFNKIYRHHKVRAAEAMVAAIVDLLKNIWTEAPWTLPLFVYDDEVVTLSPKQLEARAVREINESDRSRFDAVCDIADRLRNRQLFVRSFAFAQKMPLDPYKGDSDQRKAIESMIRETSDPATRGEIINRLARLSAEISTKIGRQDELDSLPGGSLEPYLWIDPPAYSIIDPEPDTNRAYLIEDSDLMRVEHANAETRGWADAYVNTRDIGYVFCPREYSDLVYLASEVLARTEYGVRIPPSMTTYAKQDKRHLDDLRDRLETAGFFDNRPSDLRPLPPRLRRADAKGLLQDIVGRLTGYFGPVDLDQASGKVDEGHLNSVRVRDWVRQFPNDLADPALRCLDTIKLIGRSEINAALQSVLDSDASYKTASIVPLGDAKDGAAVLGYYVGDVANTHGAKVLPLEQAILRNAPIVFVDDLVGRGSSSISIVESLLNVEPTQTLNEERTKKLSEDASDLLRARKLAFVFAAGLNTGRDALERRTRELGLQAHVYVHQAQEVLPSVEAVLSGAVEDELKEAFVAECHRVGLQLLNDGTMDHDEEWREERAFGYGNLGLLVVNAYNTPTVSLTALWRKGTVDGIEWRPLLPRRPKR